MDGRIAQHGFSLLPDDPDESGSALADHHGGSIAWLEQSEIEDGLTPAILYVT